MTDWLDPEQVKKWLNTPTFERTLKRVRTHGYEVKDPEIEVYPSTYEAMEQFVRAKANNCTCRHIFREYRNTEDGRKVCSCGANVARLIVEALDD